MGYLLSVIVKIWRKGWCLFKPVQQAVSQQDLPIFFLSWTDVAVWIYSFCFVLFLLWGVFCTTPSNVQRLLLTLLRVNSRWCSWGYLYVALGVEVGLAKWEASALPSILYSFSAKLDLLTGFPCSLRAHRVKDEVNIRQSPCSYVKALWDSILLNLFPYTLFRMADFCAFINAPS